MTDKPPPQVAAELRDLRARLDSALPSKLLDRNLVIGTWRWERFDDVTQEWVSRADGHASVRDLRAIRCLAEIVSHFDVVAVQGLMGDAASVS